MSPRLSSWLLPLLDFDHGPRDAPPMSRRRSRYCTTSRFQAGIPEDIQAALGSATGLDGYLPTHTRITVEEYLGNMHGLQTTFYPFDVQIQAVQLRSHPMLS